MNQIPTYFSAPQKAQKIHKMLLYSFGIFLLSISNLAAQAQCGAHQALLQNLSEKEIQYFHQKNNEQLDEWLQNSSNFIKNRSVVTLPVVVHVVYHEDEENISDEQIFSQIDILNKDFRALNCQVPKVEEPFKELIADIEFEFCLATIDPDGNPTNGITRTWSRIPFFDCNSDFLYKKANGGADAWDTKRYINIWVAKLGPVVGGSTLGCGTFPNSTDSTKQGITVNYWAFGSEGPVIYPNHLGRTATHEMGHFFNLRHVFANGAPADPCEDDHDNIPDTPAQDRSYSQQCPNGKKFSCGTQDMYMNFMNYTADACMAMFTKGQKERAWATLNVFRPELLQSNACSAQSTTEQFEFELGPNPALDFFTIKIKSSSHRAGQLKVFDPSGKMVIYEPYQPINVPISLTSIQSGLYFVEFSCGELRSLTKLVKI